MRLPPLESLRMLEACVRHQNMTRAATELGVTPAAVSLRIRHLEAELGRPLFLRSGPRIAATPAAQALGAQIGAAVANLERAIDACRDASSPIRITAVPTLAARWLAQALTQYERENPGANVAVEATDSLREAGSFDLSLRHGSGRWKGLRAHRICSGEATPMLAPSLARTIAGPEDLAQLPLVPDGRWSSWFAPFGIDARNLRFTADYPSQEIAAAAVIAGAGAALLSPFLFGPMLAEGKLARPFDALAGDGTAYFVAVSESEGRPEILRLRDFLRSRADQPGTASGGD